jgi:hypothetical protein
MRGAGQLPVWPWRLALATGLGDWPWRLALAAGAIRAALPDTGGPVALRPGSHLLIPGTPGEGVG